MVSLPVWDIPQHFLKTPGNIMLIPTKMIKTANRILKSGSIMPKALSITLIPIKIKKTPQNNDHKCIFIFLLHGFIFFFRSNSISTFIKVNALNEKSVPVSRFYVNIFHRRRKMGKLLPAIFLCCFFISCASLSDFENTLKNFEYPNTIPASGVIKMQDGYFEQESKPGSMTMVQSSYIKGASGDLNGDSAEDMASVIAVSGSEDGTYYYLYVFVKTINDYRNAGSVLLGDRIVVQAVKISGKKIGIQYLSHGPDDEKNSPSQKTISIFTIYNGKLKKIK